MTKFLALSLSVSSRKLIDKIFRSQILASHEQTSGPYRSYSAFRIATISGLKIWILKFRDYDRDGVLKILGIWYRNSILNAMIRNRDHTWLRDEIFRDTDHNSHFFRKSRIE